MMHAKTAVADSRWARIGSTNLNLNSWVGNWELDVAIEDATSPQTLEAHYEEDLAHVDRNRERRRHAATGSPAGRRRDRRHRASRPRPRRVARRALRTVTGVGHSISAAVLGSRQLEEWESAPLMTLGLLLLASRRS